MALRNPVIHVSAESAVNIHVKVNKDGVFAEMSLCLVFIITFDWLSQKFQTLYFFKS